MSDTPETVRVKPSHASQGAWVVINQSDYDPEVHQLYEDQAQPKNQDQQSSAKPGKRKE